MMTSSDPAKSSEDRKWTAVALRRLADRIASGEIEWYDFAWERDIVSYSADGYEITNEPTGGMELVIRYVEPRHEPEASLLDDVWGQS